MPQLFIDELLEKVSEFERAYLIDGLSLNEYEEYGPVEYFRHMFVKAWGNSNKLINNTVNVNHANYPDNFYF